MLFFSLPGREAVEAGSTSTVGKAASFFPSLVSVLRPAPPPFSGDCCVDHVVARNFLFSFSLTALRMGNHYFFFFIHTNARSGPSHGRRRRPFDNGGETLSFSSPACPDSLQERLGPLFFFPFFESMNVRMSLACPRAKGFRKISLFPFPSSFPFF